MNSAPLSLSALSCSFLRYSLRMPTLVHTPQDALHAGQ